MKHARVGLVLLVCAACVAESSDTAVSANPVVLDGEFEDWVGAPVILYGPPDSAPGSEVDLGQLLGRDDPKWLYLSLDLGAEVSLQAMVGTIHLLVDADANSETGHTAFGMNGVDFALDMSRMDVQQADGHGAGFALRTVGADGLADHRSAYDTEAVGVPTWAATRFEIRMAREGAPDGFARMADKIRTKLVREVEGRVLDETAVGAYSFATPQGPDPFMSSLEPLNKVSGAVRIAQWNVASEAFQEPADHAALLGAVRPDVIMLDEVYGDVTREALEAFFQLPPLAALGDWRFVLGRSGGRQKTVVATRGLPIRPAPSMVRVEYPHGALDGLRPQTPEDFHGLLDREAGRHLAATGAWVTIDHREVLFVPLDLESGGYNGGPDDLLRDLQGRTIRAHALAEIDASGTRAPVVIGGDFNLVGSGRPLARVAEGMDTDGSALAASNSSRLGERTLSTWRNPQLGLFTPGRLDFTLFSDRALQQVGGFVFATEDLTDSQLSALGLTREQSSRPSDHLIVVTDLRVR